jgi:hypothetical protein
MIVATDFVDKWAISKAYGSSKLNEYIDANEAKIMANLFGVAMYEEWLADDELYPELFLPFQYQLVNDEIVHSDSIKTMLLNMIYAVYTRDSHVTATSGGNVVLTPEGGKTQTDSMATYIRFWNSGISTFRAIQARIKDNQTDYPLYRGVDMQTTFFV